MRGGKCSCCICFIHEKLMHSDSSAHSELEPALSASTSDSDLSEEETRRSRIEKRRQKENVEKAAKKDCSKNKTINEGYKHYKQFCCRTEYPKCFP